MKNLALVTIVILMLFSCNNTNPPQRVYVDGDGDCRGCGGIGYTVKACRCVGDPEGVGKQNSHYDMRDGEIIDCIMCVRFGRALFEEKGCEIGEVAEDCSICSRN